MEQTKIKLIVEEIEKKNFHLFVIINIGKKFARLLLDTGASKTVFDKGKILKFVKLSRLLAHEGKSVGLGISDAETQVVKLNNIQIGKLAINSFEVAVLDISNVNITYNQISIPDIDGVLGSDFLMKYKATIDFNKGVLVLRK